MIGIARGVRSVLIAIAAMAALAFPVRAEDRVDVVATFSILGDFAANVGGARVRVTTLVGPGGDTHVYTPTPSDAKTVARAKLVVVNGLGLEGWLPRLVVSSGGKASTVVASKGVTPRKSEGGRDRDAFNADPHAWQSVANAKIYVANIRDALAAADPAGADIYRANAAAYLDKLDALEREVRQEIGRIPPDRRSVITTHDAFGYFSVAYGIAFVAPQGVSTDTEPGAREVAAIIAQIRKQKIPAVFLENIRDSRLVRQIASETGARIGGTLYSDSLTDEKGEAPTYIEMVRHNIKALSSALSG